MNWTATTLFAGDLFRILPALVLVGAGIYGFRAIRKYIFADNFGVVEKGRLYRSGQLYPFQLNRVVARHGIRTIIRTNEPELPKRIEERYRAVCDRHGVKTIPLIMPGDGRGDFDQYDEAVRILSSPGNLPALVCCARGTHRTGAVIACYRVMSQGMAVQDALGEMERYRFRPRPHRYKGGEHPLVPHLKDYFRTRARTRDET